MPDLLPPSATSIGIDIGGTKIHLAYINAKGEIQQQLIIPTRVKEGYATIVKDIIDAVNSLQSKSHATPCGIGIGIAGQVEPETGLVHFAPNLYWTDVPLKADLHKALGLEISITNDVRAATLAEWHFGAGRGCKDFICLFVGTGTGGGIVSGGHLISGHSNAAGELGHLIVDPNGPLCTCGNRGCCEAIASGWGIATLTQEYIKAHPDSKTEILDLVQGKAELITAKHVITAYHQGDAVAKKIIDRVEKALITESISIVNAFNPQRLIFGGGIVNGLPELISVVKAGIKKGALKVSTNELEVLPAQLKNDAGVIGAATLALGESKKKQKSREGKTITG